MKKYLLIGALAAMAAGCETEHHGNPYGQAAPPPHPMAQENVRQRPAQDMPPKVTHQNLMRESESGMGPGETLIFLYFKEARQNLLEARTSAYLTSEQYANLLEKLQADMREVLLEEAKGHHPPPPAEMPIPHHPPPPAQ